MSRSRAGQPSTRRRELDPARRPIGEVLREVVAVYRRHAGPILVLATIFEGTIGRIVLAPLLPILCTILYGDLRARRAASHRSAAGPGGTAWLGITRLTGRRAAHRAQARSRISVSTTSAARWPPVSSLRIAVAWSTGIAAR